MKVSERLRELGEEGAIVVVGLETPLHAVGGPAPASVTLRNVLPLITDVVEAAENVTFFGQEAHRYNEWHGSRIVLALTALNDALEGGDVT